MPTKKQASIIPNTQRKVREQPTAQKEKTLHEKLEEEMPDQSETESDAPPLSAAVDKVRETPAEKRQRELRNLENSVRMAISSSDDEST